MEICEIEMCNCYRLQEINHCRDWVDISLCKFRDKLIAKEAPSSSRSSAGLCAQDLKAWLRATRVESKVGNDPFILYQQGIMTKGALLEVIVDEVEAYFKKRA